MKRLLMYAALCCLLFTPIAAYGMSTDVKLNREMELTVSYHINCSEGIRNRPINFIDHPLPARDVATLLCAYLYSRYGEEFVKIVKEGGSSYYTMPYWQFKTIAKTMYGYEGTPANEGTLTVVDDVLKCYILPPNDAYRIYFNAEQLDEDTIPLYKCIRAELNDYGIIKGTFVYESDSDVPYEVFSATFMLNDNKTLRLLSIEPVSISLDD